MIQSELQRNLKIIYGNGILVTQLNAKELILAKINASKKLAKVYLFLITMGFDINDIVSFMTSPTISFIDKITDTNIYGNSGVSMADAIEIALGNYSSIITQVIGKNTELTKSQEYQRLKEGDTSVLEDLYKKHLIDEYEKDSLDYAINSIKSFQNYNPKDSNNQEDITEFKNALDAANEFSNFARILGLNQGLPTNKEELEKVKNNFKRIMKDGNEDIKVDDKPFDLFKFLNDEEYQKKCINALDAHKICINALHAIVNIPHYKSILDLLKATLVVDENIAYKSVVYNTKLAPELDRFNNIDDYKKRCLGAIDNILISQFLFKSKLRVPYMAGVKLLENTLEKVTVTDGYITFDSYMDFGSFKFYFENYLIPMLQKGQFYKETDSGIILDDSKQQELTENIFIKELIRGSQRDTPLYKVNLDLLSVNNSNHAKIKFNQYVRGIKKLQEIVVCKSSDNKPITMADLFIVYNLIVNKNRYGNDRLTKVFEGFLSERSNDDSIIEKFLTFIGKLDYETNAESDLSNIDAIDIMIAAARPVKSTFGQKDPYVIIVDKELGIPRLFKRTGIYKNSNYVEDTEHSIIDTSSVNNLQTRMQVYRNQIEYMTLGGIVSESINIITKALRSLDENTMNMLNALEKDGTLIAYIKCD